MFLIGTTLATYSAFRYAKYLSLRVFTGNKTPPVRLLKHALELSKPVLMLNIGPTRADSIEGIEKISLPSGLVLRDAVKVLV